MAPQAPAPDKKAKNAKKAEKLSRVLLYKGNRMNKQPGQLKMPVAISMLVLTFKQNIITITMTSSIYVHGDFLRFEQCQMRPLLSMTSSACAHEDRNEMANLDQKRIFLGLQEGGNKKRKFSFAKTLTEQFEMDM